MLISSFDNSIVVIQENVIDFRKYILKYIGVKGHYVCNFQMFQKNCIINYDLF